MAMSRKHYTEAAEIIKTNVAAANMLGEPGDIAAAQAGIEYVARDLASMFARENSRFNRDKFLAACGF